MFLKEMELTNKYTWTRNEDSQQWSGWRESFASALKGADRGSPPSFLAAATLARIAFRLFESRTNKQKSPKPAEADFGLLVRVARLELAASWSQRRVENYAYFIRYF